MSLLAEKWAPFSVPRNVPKKFLGPHYQRRDVKNDGLEGGNLANLLRPVKTPRPLIKAETVGKSKKIGRPARQAEYLRKEKEWKRQRTNERKELVWPNRKEGVREENEKTGNEWEIYRKRLSGKKWRKIKLCSRQTFPGCEESSIFRFFDSLNMTLNTLFSFFPGGSRIWTFRHLSTWSTSQRRRQGPGYLLYHPLHRHVPEGGPQNRLLRRPPSRGTHFLPQCRFAQLAKSTHSVPAPIFHWTTTSISISNFCEQRVSLSFTFVHVFLTRLLPPPPRIGSLPRFCDRDGGRGRLLPRLQPHYGNQ